VDAQFNYREAAVRGASPVRLVILLYEQVIDDLRRAAAAQQQRRIEQRAHYVDHALLVLGHLEATLDAAQGGAVAVNLQNFYRQIRAGIVAAQIRQSVPDLEAQIMHLMLVRDAWEQLERSTMSAVPASELHDSGPDLEPHSPGEWRA
jgi:flagellar protein FliS